MPAERAVIQIRVWQVPTRDVPRAMSRMAWQPTLLRRRRGMAFAKLLGAGAGDSFTVRDPDLHRWVLLTVFDNAAAADEFESSRLLRRWRAISSHCLRLDLATLSCRGAWSRRQPFRVNSPSDLPADHQPPSGNATRRWSGPVVGLTRARIRPGQWRHFAAAVGPVAADLRQRDGLLFRTGIGELPIGLQGTLSIWSDNAALTDFARGGAAHRRVIDLTHQRQWYAEELFARFALLSHDGGLPGVQLDRADG